MIHDSYAVHPHVCGERFVFFIRSALMSGSSPRVWGTPGKPSSAATRTGSSPRVWGTLLAREVDAGAVRFIPTCVGNAPGFWKTPGLHAVHPHVCGERLNHGFFQRSDAGSSPRVWGTPIRIHRNSIPSRFIPTCVGNANSSPLCFRYFSVHPHVCGERISVTRTK